MRLIALVFLGLVLATSAWATVSCEPPDTTIALGSVFEVRIVTTDVQDLMCYKLVYSYDPSVVEFLTIEPGDLMTEAPGDWVAFIVPDAPPADTLRYDACVLGGHADGAGILAYLRFKAVGAGVSPLQCVTVDFRDPDNGQTFPDCISGRMQDDVVLRAIPSTWARLKALWR
jgi:hypothetical protein